MGVTQSNDKRQDIQGGIFIQIDKTDFISNEVIEGLLHINLEEKFLGHLLIIQLDGIEESRFEYSIIKNNRKENKKARGIKKFLSVSMPIYDFATVEDPDNFLLQPGQWSVPFQMKIAEKLPSSIRYFKSITHNCSIQYALSAYILPKQSSCRPVQGTQPIFICQQITNQTEIAKKQIDNAPLFSCCLSAGSYGLTCSLSQHSYAPSEIISMIIEYNLSQFKKKLDKIKVELIGHLKMTADNNFIEHKEQLYISKIEVQLNTNEQKAIANIPVPASICCSAQGSVIDVEYELVVTPVLNLSCLKGNDSLSLPVLILPQKKNDLSLNYPQLNHVKTPENWNPKMLEQEEYSEQQSLKIQQLYLEFQEQQTQLMYQNIASQIQNLDKPVMASPLLK